jgi:hypothetical protein
MPSTFTSRAFLRKSFFLAVFVLGFFSIASSVHAATITIHPQSTISNSTWKAERSSGDTVCIGGDGASGSAWSGWACVNDQPSNAAFGSSSGNEGTTYVRSQLSTTSSDEGVVGFGSGLVPAEDTITNFSVVSYGRQHNCSSCANYQLYYRIGSSGAKTFGASHVPPSTSSWTQYTDNFSVALTSAELDQLQIGFVQNIDNGSNRVRISQIYVTVTYSVVADTIFPTVSITAPAGGSTVSGTVTVSADASDNVGVVGVQFKDGAANIGAEDTTSPYSVSWNTTAVADGSHTLTAVARDAAGNITTSAGVSVTVDNPDPDTTPPSVPTGLGAVAVSQSQIDLSWNASTDPVVGGQITSGVAGYNVYRNGGASPINGSLITATSYSDTGLAPSTSYSYTVDAQDNAGNKSAKSSPVSGTTQAPPPPPNLTGYAWADNGIGWISMSCVNAGNCASRGNYGVSVSSANPGVLSGYAWANPNDGAQNHIGWISFNAADVVGCPTAPCTPTLNRSTGAVIGWARACSIFASGCSGALRSSSELGGWDGWIRLWRDSDGDGIVNTDTGAAASDYGVLVSGCSWSGYAWGGGINIGWIHFGGALYPTTGSGDGCTSSADLTAGPVSPTSAIAGTAITLSSTISNTGVGSTGAGFTNLFQFDNDADHAAVTATMTDTSPAVTAGGTDVSQVAYTFSTPGTWYVRACADNDVSFIGTIAESNEGNNCGAWTEVAVALPLLTGSFSASPDTIDPGGSSTLTWTSNATTCVGQGFSTGVGNPANGSAVVTPTTPGPNGYQIICSKSGYSDLVLATTVTVISVTATISAKPTCISGGGSSKIFWSISPVSQIQSGSCRLSGPGLSSNPLTVSPDGSAPNASPQTATVNTKTPYTILCTTTGGSSVSKSVIVDVSGCWAEF